MKELHQPTLYRMSSSFVLFPLKFQWRNGRHFP